MISTSADPVTPRRGPASTHRCGPAGLLVPIARGPADARFRRRPPRLATGLLLDNLVGKRE
jgi:hypothetical protein